MRPINLTRRGILTSMGGLVLGLSLPGCKAALPTERAFLGLGDDVAPGGLQRLNAWLQIGPDGEVVIRVASSEMGQGVLTALPMIVAEELDADWNTVRAEMAPAHKAYRHNLGPGMNKQVTGGSDSVEQFWEPLRVAGASARWMLVTAAARAWGVDRDSLSTEAGHVVHASTGRRVSYGGLVAAASKLPVPHRVQLKDPANFKILGSTPDRLDVPSKVDGSGVFGLDVRRPHQLFASVIACPTFGGRLDAVDDAAAMKMPGVRQVVVLADAVAVVADSTWQAMTALKSLVITWDRGDHAALDSAGVQQAIEGALSSGGRALHKQGDVDAAIAGAAKTVEAQYSVPYAHHATMEPINCTVHVQPDRCDVWVGTQGQQAAQAAAAEATGLDLDRVFIHTTFLGGGFGRRSEPDFVAQATQIAVQVDGPVQVAWTREEGFRHGFYRPAFLANMRGAVDADGKVVGYASALAGQSVLERFVPPAMIDLAPVAAISVEGLQHLPYGIPHQLCSYARVDLPIPTGFWRSVGHSYTGFFKECFLDELAHASGQDPVAMRLAMLDESPRHKAALERVVAVAKWGETAPGRFKGVALHESFGSIVAEVAEVSAEGGALRVHKVWAAVECGPIVHPDIISQQIMSGVHYGLSSACFAELSFAQGGVVEGNFDSYGILRMAQSPEVEVHIVEGLRDEPGGIGEVSVPPVIPAVLNAWFAATGERVRSLPLHRQIKLAGVPGSGPAKG